jgi:hypothetical protein
LLASGQFRAALQSEGASLDNFTEIGTFVFKGSQEKFQVYYVRSDNQEVPIELLEFAAMKVAA